MKPGYPATEMIMAETLVVYDAFLKARDGNVYRARACGRGRDDGLWEGWLEFTSVDNVVATGRETTPEAGSSVAECPSRTAPGARASRAEE